MSRCYVAEWDSTKICSMADVSLCSDSLNAETTIKTRVPVDFGWAAVANGLVRMCCCICVRVVVYATLVTYIRSAATNCNGYAGLSLRLRCVCVWHIRAQSFTL